VRRRATGLQDGPGRPRQRARYETRAYQGPAPLGGGFCSPKQRSMFLHNKSVASADRDTNSDTPQKLR